MRRKSIYSEKEGRPWKWWGPWKWNDSWHLTNGIKIPILPFDFVFHGWELKFYSGILVCQSPFWGLSLFLRSSSFLRSACAHIKMTFSRQRHLDYSGMGWEIRDEVSLQKNIFSLIWYMIESIIWYMIWCIIRFTTYHIYCIIFHII